MRKFSFIVLFPLLSLLACSSGETKKDYGDELHVGIHVSEFNPNFDIFIHTFSNEGIVVDLMYTPLFDIDKEDGHLFPLLVERWETNEDQTEWLIELKENVKFHDGSILTSHDAKYSFERVRRENKSFFHPLTTSIHDLEILDDYRIKFYLKRPDVFFHLALAIIPIAKNNFSDSNSQIEQNGTGPFRFSSYDPVKKILTLISHADYIKGRPHLRAVYFHFLPNQMTTISRLLTGEIDLLYLSDPSYEDLFRQNNNFKVLYQRVPLYYVVSFNFKNAILKDKNLRLALNYAFPKENVLKEIKPLADKRGGIIRSFIPDTPFTPLYFQYNVEKARSHLAKQGWFLKNGRLVNRKGERLKIHLLTLAEHEFSSYLVYQLIRAFDQIGVETIPHLKSLTELLTEGFLWSDHDAILWPMNFRWPRFFSYYYWSSESVSIVGQESKYNNKEVDHYLKRARYDKTDRERKKAYFLFEKSLASDPPALFLFWRDLPIVVHKRFRGIPERPLIFISEIQNFWVPKEEQKYR